MGKGCLRKVDDCSKKFNEELQVLNVQVCSWLDDTNSKQIFKENITFPGNLDENYYFRI